MLLLPLLVLLSLTGCAHKISDQPTQPDLVLPMWPKAGPKVADELQKQCVPENKCPATWEWLSRLTKLRDKLPPQSTWKQK